MRKILSIAYCLVLCTLSTTLQAQDSIIVKGAVRHGLTGVDVTDACLMVRSQDGKFRQEVRVTDHSSRPDLFHTYRFQAKVPKAGTYVVQFVGEGFEQDSMVVHIPERKYGLRVKEWTAKDFLLYPCRTQELGEAVVRASRVMIVNRGDTIIYNASAFKLASGSMLDALHCPTAWRDFGRQWQYHGQWATCQYTLAQRQGFLPWGYAFGFEKSAFLCGQEHQVLSA